MLEGGDVEHGKSNGKVGELEVIEGLEVSMSEMVERVCKDLLDIVESDSKVGGSGNQAQKSRM